MSRSNLSNRRIGLRWAAAAAAALIAGMLWGEAAQAEALSDKKCVALRDGLERQIGITPAFDMWRDRVDLPPLGKREVCKLGFRSTGIIFESPERTGFEAAVASMRAALEAEGWIETPAQSPFAHAEPLLTRFAVAKGKDVCLVKVALDEAFVLGRPVVKEKPTEARLKSLSPSERIYTIELSCVSPSSLRVQ